jgi:hypothetical protein
MNRRDFLQFLGFAPVVIPAVVAAGPARTVTIQALDSQSFINLLRTSSFSMSARGRLQLNPADLSHLVTRRFESHEIFRAAAHRSAA